MLQCPVLPWPTTAIHCETLNRGAGRAWGGGSGKVFEIAPAVISLTHTPFVAAGGPVYSTSGFGAALGLRAAHVCAPHLQGREHHTHVLTFL